jgi:hypothetical protein
VTELFRFCDCSLARFQQRCATAREFNSGHSLTTRSIDRGSVHVLTIFGLPLPYAALR